MPLAWLAFSIIYLLFAFSIEARKMPQDREGWDPGSNALPIGIGYLMVALSGYLLVTDRKGPRNKPDHGEPNKEPRVDPGTLPDEPADVRALIILTLITTLLYILTFRMLGFVVSTTFLLHTLTYFYLKKLVRPSDFGEYGLSLAIVAFINVLFYSLGRWIIRWMQYFGRIHEIGVLQNRLVTALLAATAWSIVAAPIILVMNRRRKRLHSSSVGDRAAVAACFSTLGLYLVFQQIFRVALPGGIVAL
ncbi:MAG: tripartite tricarboxylate transporter TctB family protein [Spirochaetaceae bacterium]